jgi:hypothetical protein
MPKQMNNNGISKGANSLKHGALCQHIAQRPKRMNAAPKLAKGISQ